MIHGMVSQGSVPGISVFVLDQAKQPVPVHASIDTGFNGDLTLTLTRIAQLGLARTGDVLVQLADGSFSKQRYYRAQLTWNGAIRDVKVILIECKPLVGLKLLEGSRLAIDVIVGGPVTIEPIP